MRTEALPILRASRIRGGPYASTDEAGVMGQFDIPFGDGCLRAMSSGPENGDYEHVSVSRRNRTPTWEEMCFVKSLFWTDEECVMQLHPPAAEWINRNPHVLHLWKPTHCQIPRPTFEEAQLMI